MLSILDLANNYLSILDLANNYLIDHVIEKLPSLSMLNLPLNNNSLNRIINFIYNIPHVQYVQLDNNNFSGLLPDFVTYNLSQLFSISHNP